MLYHWLLKPFMFMLDAEKAHYLTVRIMKMVLGLPGFKSLMTNYYTVNNPKLKKTVFGLTFENPIGLAAGFDKDGKSYDVMSVLGFGFIEIGTVTPKAQDGNDKPRLFRIKDDQGLINRMGFNNEGVDALVERLKNRPKNNVIIGGNIGKNKITPNEKAVDDYVECFEKLFNYVDYFVVNVSSPNTPGLRELQEKEPLMHLLRTLSDLNVKKSNPKPILLKIAPDLTDTQLDDIIEIVSVVGIDGIVATNTTLDRSALKTDTSILGMGGLSGRPLHKRSIEVVSYLYRKSNGKIPIIGVGGIDSPESAKAMLEAGASLVQVYSGMVYAGPGLVKAINRSLI